MVVLEHANRLAKRGFDVSLLNIGEARTVEWFPQNSVPVYSVRSTYPIEFDIVVVTGWTTVYKARLLGLQTQRWVYLVQLDESKFVNLDNWESVLARLTYNAPFEYVVIAKWMQEWLRRDFGQSTLYVPNALNENIIFRCEPLSPRGKRLRVLLEGALLRKYKGMDDAFAVVKNLNVEVWCVTDVSPKKGQRYDRLFRSVPYDQMRNIYSSCDVLLKMSKLESFSYPPLEMMACGGTAVVTRFTGHEEYARDGENCFVVDIGDVAAAAAQIRQLAQDRALLARLCQCASETARAKTCWESSIDLLQQFFESEPRPAAHGFTAFERHAFDTLAGLVDKVVIDFHNNSMGTSLSCLRQLKRLERLLALFKRASGYGFLQRCRRALRFEGFGNTTYCRKE